MLQRADENIIIDPLHFVVYVFQRLLIKCRLVCCRTVIIGILL